LPPGRRLELGHGDQFALEVVTQQPTVPHERVGLALDRFELAVVIQHPHEHRVHDEQRRRPHDPADERIVVPNDRVLHRVGKQQEHDEVEWIELR